MQSVFNFTIKNSDITVKFSCSNYDKRIGQAVKNLMQQTSDKNSNITKCKFSTDQKDIVFYFDNDEYSERKFVHQAYFFENTEYPIIARGTSKKLEYIELFINEHRKSETDKRNAIINDNGELYGSLNFKNQVGETDFKFRYRVKGENRLKELSFSTEVLSYKLDYRNDLKSIIADVEKEYAMLSYAFLKDTYLSFKTNAGKSTELIWWQIFKDCYNDIIRNVKIIIDRPKKRLKSRPKYERAERLPFMPAHLESEYSQHKDNAAYLYKVEELILSNDTIENRFLKLVLRKMQNKFASIKSHIMTALNISDPTYIGTDITEMDEELTRINHHPFFRGIGVFKGFTQDSLVMKQATGYKDILRHWITLQQGFDLEEGIRKLEVKDISELYEIWCFIKVKNIVAEVMEELNSDTTQRVNGKIISRDFIPRLIRGGSVSFVKQNGIELATVSYNAQVEKDEYEAISAIDGTTTLTTIQRPDIVLRLSKEDDEIKYTYLFDAKYRINEQKIDGYDVPNEEDINQMHRYRDAIYTTEYGEEKENLRKEIIGGYILFPGNIPFDAIDKGKFYYQKSNKKIGIGAFPLKPNNSEQEINRIDLNPTNSERALYLQIKSWLTEGNARQKLLKKSIPQKGLEYLNELTKPGPYFLSSIDSIVNSCQAELFESGKANVFITGYNTLLAGINFNDIKFFAPIVNHYVRGFYQVTDISICDMKDCIEKSIKSKGTNKIYKGYEQPIRIRLSLGDFTALEKPFVFGVNRTAGRGLTMTHRTFQLYCKGKKTDVQEE